MENILRKINKRAGLAHCWQIFLNEPLKYQDLQLTKLLNSSCRQGVGSILESTPYWVEFAASPLWSKMIFFQRFSLSSKKTSTCWILIYSFLVSKISGALVLGLKLRLLFLCWPFAGSFSILREGNENEQRALWLRGYCHGTRYSLASLSFVYEKATTTTDGRKSSYFDNHN